MSNKTRFGLLLVLTAVLPLRAGTFTNAFNSGLPAGTAIYGNAVVLTNLGVDGGCLQLTTNVNNQNAGFIISDLDSGGVIGSFVANFMVSLGGGTTPPADGFSFNFAGDLPNGVMNEDGAGSGLRIEFDTYDNGSGDIIGVDVWWQGAIVTSYQLDPSMLTNYPSYYPVTIGLTSSSNLNMTFNGTALYTDYSIPGFAPLAGRFGFGGRCGGANEICRIDNLGIDTGPPALPQFLASSPTGTGARPDPVITARIWDGTSAQVNPATITMTLNAVTVTPTVTKTGLVTSVQYAPPQLASGSTNNVVVTFADNSGSPVTQTNQFSFVVVTYPTLPTNYLATVDTNKPGFSQRVFQGGTTTVGSVAAAENLLAGLLINPANGQPFPNTAQTNTDGTYIFVQTNVLNYNVNAPTNATSAGNFTNDAQFPGLPGTNGSLVNVAMEVLTYLYLPAGPYTFGVNSDDGFRLSSIATQVGVFDAGRAAADTTFSFAVAQTGYYPFRLVYFQGTSLASLEWFSILPSGQKVLINDTNTPGAIRAYSKATTSLPYFLGSSPLGTGNRPDKPVLVQMQDGAGIKVNTTAIRLAVGGSTVTPSITQTGGVTTVQYLPTAWPSGSTNPVVVSFADNQVSPYSQTNQYSFTVLTYSNIPAIYALSGGAVDTTKPGFIQKLFQTDRSVPATIANAEIMLAGQLTDPLGNPFPNKAANNTDGSYSFVQSNALNYSLSAPATAGDFSGDTQSPGIPGPSGSTNTFALEAITYVYLPAGYYVLGVNSDDGFRLATALNPHEQFPSQVAVFDGSRTAADTTAGFGITQAGYYPFRLVYFQNTGPASLELFSVALSGQKILVNDTNVAASLKAYRNANDTQPYVQWAYPFRTGSYFAPAGIPVYFTLVDGTPAVQLNSIQLTFNGNTVTPTVTRVNGTNIIVSFDPSSFQQTSNTTATVQLTYTDSSSHVVTDSFSFTFYGTESLYPVWSLSPGSRPYLTSDSSSGAQEAGLGYNPVTSHLVLGSISNSTTLRGFFILDALTGNDLGQLKLTNSSGVNIFAPLPSLTVNPGYSVGVADDGVIYAATKKGLSVQILNIYRWASETGVVSVAFSDSSSKFAFPMGFDFRVRGAGTNTQIIMGAGNGSSSQVVLFTTANGSNFTATTIGPVTGVANDLYGGIAFGTNNTFYAEGSPGTVLRQVGYDPVAKAGSALAAYNWIAPAGSLGPLGVDLVNGRVIGLASSTVGGNAHTVNLYDLNSLSTSAENYPVDSSYVPTTYANPSGSGSVVFTPDGSLAFVLDTENGILAYELAVKSAARPKLTIASTGTHVTLTWTDATFGLQASPTAKGTYTNVTGAVSGYSPLIGRGSLFFRLAK